MPDKYPAAEPKDRASFRHHVRWLRCALGAHLSGICFPFRQTFSAAAAVVLNAHFRAFLSLETPAGLSAGRCRRALTRWGSCRWRALGTRAGDVSSCPGLCLLSPRKAGWEEGERGFRRLGDTFGNLAGEHRPKGESMALGWHLSSVVDSLHHRPPAASVSPSVA